MTTNLTTRNDATLPAQERSTLTNGCYVAVTRIYRGQWSPKRLDECPDALVEDIAKATIYDGTGAWFVSQLANGEPQSIARWASFVHGAEGWLVIILRDQGEKMNRAIRNQIETFMLGGHAVGGMGVGAAPMRKRCN